MSPHEAQAIAGGFDLGALPPAFLADPYPVYAALRESTPVRRMPDGSLFLTRCADCVAIYRDAKSFTSEKTAEFGPKFNLPPFSASSPAPLYEHHTTSLVFNDAPAHTRVRQAIMGALTRRAVSALEADLTWLVDGLLDAIERRGGGCLIEDFASAIPVEVIGNLLAVPRADRGPLRAWSLAILGALEPRLTEQQLTQGNAAVIQFKAYLADLTADRRKQPGDPEHDVLTRLIQAGTPAQVGGPTGEALNESELLQNCIFLLNAGHETTTNLIGNALAALALHPDARQQMLQIVEQTNAVDVGQSANLSTLLPMECAVDEFLRFESSNQLSNRRAACPFTLNGAEYPAGTLLTLCIGAANRDPAQFADPNTLALGRSPNKHLAFGLGLHQCAGLSLARLEGRVAIGRFMQRFADFKLTQAPTRGGRARFRGYTKAPFSCA